MRTVVLCGSLGSSRELWDPQLPALEGFDVVRVDHPGHGGEPLAPVADVRDLAARVLDRVDAETFSFVGLSLGGAVGMRISLDAPERLDRLVLACTSARFGQPALWEERAALVRAEGVGAIADLVLERWFSPAFPDVERFRAMLLSTDPEGYARCCDALARWDVRNELPKVTTPTLCIAGAEDPSTPPDQLELIAELIPGSRLDVLGGARHLANVERAPGFNRLVLEHLG